MLRLRVAKASVEMTGKGLLRLRWAKVDGRVGVSRKGH